MAIDPEVTRPRPRLGAHNRARVNDAKQACTWNPEEANSGHGELPVGRSEPREKGRE